MAQTQTYGLAETAALRPMEAPQLPYQPRNPKRYNPPIGLIGCGGISQSHLRAYLAAGFNVVALCDCNLERATARQKEFFPAARVYEDYRDLLKRDDIEVVDIAAHPAQRATLVPATLEARKHVLSQKPFVVDLDFGARLCDLADQKRVKLAVNQNGRWSPHVAWTRLAIERGLVGDVLGTHLACHWDHDWIAGTAFDNVHHIILYDYAIHWFDMVHCFMPGKQPTRITASIRNARGQRAVPPLLGQAIIDYEDAQATLVFDGFTRFGGSDTLYISGTAGAIDCRGPDLNKHEIKLYTSSGYCTPDLKGEWFVEGFWGTMAELLCAVEENRVPYNNARDNLNSLAMCFAAVASADSGISVKPGTVRTCRS